MRKYLKKVLVVAPWVILVALGVWFSSQWLAELHYREFTQPFLYDQKLSK